jgi:RNA polymerase sigma factor (sigma-70 family)
VIESEENTSRTENNVSSREVFASLYEQYMPGVYRYIHYRVGNVQLAEDITSAVFEKVLTSFSRYQSDRASFLTWLMSIARNMVIDHYRTMGRRKNIPMEEANKMSFDNLSLEQEVVKGEELQRLQVCLAGLSQHEQEIISLKFSAELTNRRIAGILSMSESNVGTILYRAVSKLRDCFRKWQNG